ncbi:transposase, MuDR, MULE transposase domain protein [Tanacetum coccineum]
MNGYHIMARMLEAKIMSAEFYTINDHDAVSLCLLAISELVLLGQESRHNVPDWCFRFVNDRDAWDMYPWGSYVWPTLYSSLRNTNVKRWPVFYATPVEEGDDKPKYTLSGFTWAFKSSCLAFQWKVLSSISPPFFCWTRPSPRLTPYAFEASADWWVSSRALFDGRICKPPRIPSPVNLYSRDDPPVDIYRRMKEQDRALKEKNEVQFGTMPQAKKGPIFVGQRYGLSDLSGFQNAQICTFVNYLRPLLIIDAAHLKGQYKGTNLLAVGMDGNNQIMPVAFGICKEETGPCWSWWMFVLKECIGDNPNLLFISDRHPAIALSVRNEFPLAFHGACTPEEFTSNMNILQVVQPDAYHKLCEAGPQRWSRAHFPLIRYNYMTSNSVESVNACTVLKRKLPITMLAETYRVVVQDWYFKCREVAANMKYEITDWVADMLHKRKLKSAAWIVHGVNQYQYQVSDGRYNRKVNFMTGSCECRK